MNYRQYITRCSFTIESNVLSEFNYALKDNLGGRELRNLHADNANFLKLVRRTPSNRRLSEDLQSVVAFYSFRLRLQCLNRTLGETHHSRSYALTDGKLYSTEKKDLIEQRFARK